MVAVTNPASLDNHDVLSRGTHDHNVRGQVEHAQKPITASIFMSLSHSRLVQHERAMADAAPAGSTTSCTANLDHVEAIRTTLRGLGVEPDDGILAGLASRYDGFTPMTRFLVEKGHWTPLPGAEK